MENLNGNLNGNLNVLKIKTKIEKIEKVETKIVTPVKCKCNFNHQYNCNCNCNYCNSSISF